MKHSILPTITTTDKNTILEKIDECVKFNLSEVCLFLTGLDKKERIIVYQKLIDSKIKNIPFVHIKSDFDKKEINLLKNNFKTKYFNIHSPRINPLSPDLLSLKKSLLIENTFIQLDKKEINEFGGICIDFSHLEDRRLEDQDIYNNNLETILSFPHPCGHISAIKKSSVFEKEINGFRHSEHFSTNNNDFIYLKRYSKLLKDLDYTAIELENSISEQLEIISYINGIIK